MNDSILYCQDKYLIDIRKFKEFDKPLQINDLNEIIKVKDENNEIYVAKSFKNQNDDLQRKYFSREIKILLKVQHPTIIEFKGFSYQGIHEQKDITFVMKYMKNESLSKFFNESKLKLDNTQLQIIIVGISFGMMILHKNHIINRDLKPENVLLYDDCTPCLTDFNLSKSFSPAHSIHQSGICIGTISYMAPEIIRGSNCSTKVDVYSFGILLIEIITGKRILDGVKEINHFEYCINVTKGKRPEIPQIFKNKYPYLIYLINKCISADPDERPTFRELFKKLSLLPKEFYNKYEDKFPFLKDDNNDDQLEDSNYSLENVNISLLQSYVEKLLNSIKPEKIVDDAKYSKTKEIFQQIFELNIIDAKIPSNIQEDKYTFLRNLMFFYPDENDYEYISQNIQHCTLNQFNDFFIFPVIYQNLNQIIQNIDLIEIDGIFEIYSFYTFFTWISLSCQILIEQSKIDLVIILTILNKIINNTQKSKYKEIASLCFIHIIKMANEEDLIHNYNDLFEEMNIFYNDDYIMPIHSNELLVSISQKLMNSSKSSLDDKLNKFIGIIIKIINHSFDKMDANIIQPKIFLELVHRILIKYEITNKKEDESDKNQINKITLLDDSDYFHAPKNLYQFNEFEKIRLIDDFKVHNLSIFLNADLIQNILMIKSMSLCIKKFAQINLSNLIIELLNLKIKKSKFIFYKQFAFISFLISSIIQAFPDIEFENINTIKTELFDPNITYFKHNLNSDIVCSIRHFTFKFLINRMPDLLNQILQQYLIYPELFLEFLYHLKLIYEEKDKKLDLLQFSDILIRSFVIYRVDSDSNNLTKNDKLFLHIRKMVYYFYNDFKNNLKLLESEVFINFYFILLIEPPIQKNIIWFLSKYLISINTRRRIKTKYFFESCLDKLLKACYYQMTQNRGISLFAAIFNEINEAADSTDNVTHSLIYFRNDIYMNLKNIDVKRYTEANMDNVIMPEIDFLSKIYQKEPINEIDECYLESLIMYFYPKLTQLTIIQKLIEITANEKMQIMKPFFEIMNPKALRILIRIFIKTNHIYNIMNFISKLCSFSLKNCIKCHEDGFDLFIIDIISEWMKKINKIIPKKEESKIIINQNSDENINYFDGNNNFVIVEDREGIIINEELIDIFLHIFSQIASTISSIPIVTSYFSLLMPIKENHYSLIYQKIVNVMNEILIFSKTLPSAPFPMQSNKIQINNILKNDLGNGFSFIFWILIPSPKDNPLQYHNIFEINDDWLFHILIDLYDNKTIGLSIKKIKIFATYPINFDLPFNKWIMMTFNIIVDCNKNESTISIYFNDKNIETIKTDFLLIPKKQCKCIINKSNNKQLNPPLLGTFMLTGPLLDKEIINMFNNGQRKLICLSNPPIFAYKPVYDKDVISYIPHHTCIKNTNNKIKVVPYQYIYTFFDLIFNHLDFRILIPIFEHSNKILINGIKIDFNDKIGVKILSNLFNLGKEFQHSFCKSKCFYSLAHYFLIAEDSTINYDLYITYFDLLSSISYEKLQIQLIDVILMNFDLWSKCHIEDRLKIFEHWNAYLYFNYKSLIGSIRPPEWFLYNISNFFNPTNLDDQNYFKCRQIFYFITHKSLICNLTIDHIFLIISLVINKKTLTEKIDMFNFLTTLLFEEILKESNNLDLSNIIQPILLVLNNELMDDIIVKGIITLFIKIHKSNKFKLQIPFDLLIQKIVIELNYHQEFIIYQ